MFLLGTQRVNSKGHLEIGGCDLVDLAAEFGTPLYIMDEKLMRENCQAFKQAFEKRYPKVFMIYAGKAFLTQAMCKLVEQEGLGLDISSGGELYTALKADFPTNNIYFNGNNKSPEELEMALANGVGKIVVDNFYELEMLSDLTKSANKIAEVLIRVTPGVETHTHEYDQTGQVDTKFGLPIQGGQAQAAVKLALDLPNIHFKGIHCHIGSQLLELRPFELTTKIMMDFIKLVYDETGAVVEELNLGGGLGVRYTPDDAPPSIDELAEVIVNIVKAKVKDYGLELPKLICEPGRWIVSEAGTTVYKLGAIKELPGIRKYVSVDGGMSDNPRPALYAAKYNVIVANKANQTPQELVTIAGKHCEADVLIWDIELPKLSPGDLLAVQCTGAYCYSMASNYNRLPRPPVLLVRDSQAKVIVERESYEDLVRFDLFLKA